VKYWEIDIDALNARGREIGRRKACFIKLVDPTDKGIDVRLEIDGGKVEKREYKTDRSRFAESAQYSGSAR